MPLLTELERRSAGRCDYKHGAPSGALTRGLGREISGAVAKCAFRISGFGILSDFGFRISDFLRPSPFVIRHSLPVCLLFLAAMPFGAAGGALKKSTPAQLPTAQARNASKSKTEDAGTLAELKVFPSSVELNTKRDRQSVVVQATYADGITRDATAEATYTFAQPAIAKLDKSTLYPLSDGKTDLKIGFGGKTLVVPVTVTKAAEERPISFKLDVMPVFMKGGCNAGSCHGAARGKDGFRLSLFGYDPENDHRRLTTEFIGRRVNLAIPQESLMLEKPTGKVQHTGGQRFTEDSEMYQTLLRWLKASVPLDGTNVPRCTNLEIEPRQMVLEGGATHRVTVKATYSDGSHRDVTTMALYLSNNDPSAKISQEGLVTADQRGEAFVMARYATFTVGSQVIVIPKGLQYAWPGVPENNFIDTLVNAKLKKMRLLPSGLCDDATFLRRAHLDITGTLPAVEEVDKFLADADPKKRERVVDQLLTRKEFVELWVMKWAELLQIRSVPNRLSYKAALLYYDWLQDKFANNVPINQIVEELLTASGGTFKNPASNYYQHETDTLKTAENLAQVFMGIRVQCAQCHNHPFDRWTMNDYYGFAAFFARIGRKAGEDPRETIVFANDGGEVTHPVDKRVMAPKFLGGAEPDCKNQDRRALLAKWLVSPENPFFARNLVNIIWAHFMGKGIVEPVDDVRASNPASNPELLDALANKLIEQHFDFKKLVREICCSRTYQLASELNETNAGDTRDFSHAPIRRLRAEVLNDCISQVTETKDKFRGLPRGAHAVQIADGATSSYFLTTFGRASRETCAASEVKTDPTLSQALHLLNGDAAHQKIRQGGVVARLLKEGKTPAQVIENLYPRCLGRKPTDQEMSKLGEFLKDDKQNEQVLDDLFWSLLNSKEFVFNH